MNVEGPAVPYFASELEDLGENEISEQGRVISVVPVEDDDLPTKPAGSRFGLRLPFGESDSTIVYNPRVDPYVLFAYAEASLMWGNKSFLHAGAVGDSHGAYVFTGSGGVGKTSTVLALIRKGYDYFADDWLVVGGGRAFPYPKRVHIFDYNIADRELARRLLGVRRFGYRVLYRLLNLGMAAAPHRLVVYGLEQVKPRIQASIMSVIPGARVGRPAELRKVFYLYRNRAGRRGSVSVDPEELARRMASVNRYERDFFYREYFKYVEAFGCYDLTVEARFREEAQILADTFRHAEIIPLEVSRNVGGLLPTVLKFM